LYRKEVENNLEFLTDDQLLRQAEIEKTSYQMSLLKVAAPHFPLNLTTNYNQSLLKKRLLMMNAKKSSAHTAWKYCFLLPLLLALTCVFNKNLAAEQAAAENKDEKKEEIVESIKALDITPAYLKTFRAKGYKDVSAERAVSLKALGISVSTIDEYKGLGFDSVFLEDVISAKSTGTTPSVIITMKQKGINRKSMEDYIKTKVATDLSLNHP
jgi:hypothetical protein